MKIQQGSYDAETIRPAWLPTVDGDGRPGAPVIRCRCGAIVPTRRFLALAVERVAVAFYHPVIPTRPTDRPGCGWRDLLVLDGCPPPGATR